MRVQRPRVDGHIDTLAVIPVLVAGVGVIEQQLAGGVFLEESCEEFAVVALLVGEMVQPECGTVVPAVPPCVADVFAVVAFAGREVVVEVFLTPVCGEGLDVGVLGNGALDVVTREAGGDDVRVEAVEEVLLLIREGRGGGGEVALAGEGEEFRWVGHDGDDRFVEVPLHLADEFPESVFEVGDLDE